VFPSQHPLGQDVASHTHVPLLEHSWPLTHATHAVPGAPQAFVVDVSHAPVAEQQPMQVPSQEQAWLSQACSAAQVAHCAPPLPHSATVVPRAHTPLESQQPSGQVAGPQPAASGAPSVASSDASGLEASTVASSSGPDSGTLEETITSGPAVASRDGSLASPDVSVGGAARQPVRTSASANAKSANVPRKRPCRTFTIPL
jgi:hypothetical protein